MIKTMVSICWHCKKEIEHTNYLSHIVQYIWGQYAMHNLGANSLQPPVDMFTNFMVGRNPLVIEQLLLHSKSQVSLSQGASFFSPKILLSFVLDFTVVLRYVRNK
jgi:hypothetical protein